MVNLGLMVLNLLPIPPLDGGRIVVEPAAAPARVCAVRAIEPYGFFILHRCCWPRNALGVVLGPLVTRSA